MRIRGWFNPFRSLLLAGAALSAVPAGAFAAGDLLRVMIRDVPPGFDMMGQRVAPGMPFEHLVHCSLLNDAGHGDLARSWNWSDDGRSLTMILHDDRRFSDGAPVTSYDVMASYEAALRWLPVRPAAFSRVNSVVAPNLTTVRFELENHDELLLEGLSFPVFKKGSPAFYRADAPTCGAYSVESIEWPNSKGESEGPAITLRRHDTLPITHRPARLRLAFGGTRVAIAKAIATAQADVVLPGEDSSHAGEWTKRFRNWTILRAEQGGAAVWLNVTSFDPFLVRPEARLGLALLIDRDAALIPIFGGFAHSSRFLMPLGSSAEALTTDIARGRSLLIKVGLPMSSNLKKNPSMPAWTIVTDASPRTVLLAKAVAADWNRQGLDVTVKAQTPKGDSMFRLQRESCMWAWQREFPMPFCFGHCGDKIESAVESWRSERNSAKSGEARERMSLVIHDRLPSIPLWSEDLVVLARNGLSHVKPASDGTLTWLSDIEFH